MVVAGTSAAGTPIWVRYCLGGANGDALVMGTTARTPSTPAPADPGAACPTTSTGGWTYGRLVDKGLVAGDTLFVYSTASGAVRSVAIRLERTVPKSRSVVLTSAVSPRNLP